MYRLIPSMSSSGSKSKNVLLALGINWRKDSNSPDFIIHDGWNCALKIFNTKSRYTTRAESVTYTNLDERKGCHDASFHLFLMLVVGQCARRPSGGSDWETNRNQKPVVWGVPQGVIHFLLTFPFYVFFPLLPVSLWWRCAENDSRKMVLAPKWNLRHKHHRAGCPLAGAGCFALEKQIQTGNSLLAHWTASNTATLTFFFLKKISFPVSPCLYLSDRDSSVFKWKETKKVAETKVLQLLSGLGAVQYVVDSFWEITTVRLF